MSRFIDDGVGIEIIKKEPVHFKTVNPPAWNVICRECSKIMLEEDFAAGHDCEAK